MVQKNSLIGSQGEREPCIFGYTCLQQSFHCTELGKEGRELVVVQMPQTLTILPQFQYIFLNKQFFICHRLLEQFPEALNGEIFFLIFPVYACFAGEQVCSTSVSLPFQRWNVCIQQASADLKVVLHNANWWFLFKPTVLNFLVHSFQWSFFRRKVYNGCYIGLFCHVRDYSINSI